MKKLLFSILLLSVSILIHAQYQQTWFNHAAARVEHFEDGIKTQYNYALPATPYYIASAGVSYGNQGPVVSYDRARFMRLLHTGVLPAPANKSYEFTIPGAINPSKSIANSLCEIDVVAKNGGYILAGKISHASLVGGSDALLFNVSNAGVASNQVAIDLGGAEEAMCIKKSIFSANRYLVCGYTTYTVGAQSYTEPFVMKVQSNGTIDWVSRFSADMTNANIIGITKANYLSEDPGTGDVYVAGTYKDEAFGASSNGFIFKVNNVGLLQWQKRYEDPAIAGDVEFHSIKRTTTGDYVVGGWSSENGGITSSDMLLMKINNLGGIITQNLFRVTNGGVNTASKAFDVIERINLLGNADYYLTGPTIVGGINTNLVNYKINYTTPTYEHYIYSYAIGSNNEHGYAIDMIPNAMPNAGLISFSSVNTPLRPANTDGYFLRSSFNGCTCNGYCPAVAQVPIVSNMVDNVLYTNSHDGNNRIVLAVNTFNCTAGTICNQNWAAILAAGASNARLANVEDESTEQKNTVNDFITYPNPLETNTLWLQSQLNEAKATSIKIYNMNGMLVKDLGLVSMEPIDVLEISFDEMSAGMYTINIQYDDLSVTKRIVKK